MAISVGYRPPKVNAAVAISAVAGGALHEGLKVILEAANQNVPVEDGVLLASGRVVSEGTHAAITYGKDDDGGGTHAPSNQYVVKQHEDPELNHPNGGTFKWLESAIASHREEAAAAVAAALRKALI